MHGYTIVAPTVKDAIQAGLWTWAHSDPMDRLLAAVALGNSLALIHTDERLKKLAGFPQKYFPGMH